MTVTGVVDPSIITRGLARVEPLRPEIQLEEPVPTAGPPPRPAPSMPPPRPRRSGKLLPWVALVLVFWVPPAAWVALAQPRFLQASRPLAVSKQRLSAAAQALRSYMEAHKKLPATFQMLRAFARAEALAFSSYDGYGQRLDYVRLDPRHYILRSFAADGTQNTLGGVPDVGVVSWGERPDRPIGYRTPRGPRIELYPAALLEGCDSPDGNSHARLFVDAETLTRRLVVRLKARGEFFMVAPHDRVEEFFWLPSSHKIAYTATGSTRHRDGLYLWDLDDDSVENLSDLARGALPISPAARGANLWLSLAGVSEIGPTVYVFAGPRHDGTLDPAQFFVDANLFGFQLSAGGAKGAKVLTGEALKGLSFQAPYRKPLSLGTGLDATGGTKAQLDWLKLGFEGNLENILLNWHAFAESHAESPIFPYALWLLSSLYGESFEQLARLHSKDADVLRTFGTEISRALINLELAPTYLKSLALFTHEQLMDGLPVPYRLGQLALPAPPPPKGEAPKLDPTKDPGHGK